MSEPPPKRRPGRPRKYPLPVPNEGESEVALNDATSTETQEAGPEASRTPPPPANPPPKKRGRPRKTPSPLTPDTQPTGVVKRKPGRPPGSGKHQRAATAAALRAAEEAALGIKPEVKAEEETTPTATAPVRRNRRKCMPSKAAAS